MEESYRLWRIRKTTVEMLRDRGYNVLPGDLSMKYEKFKDTFSDTPSGGNTSKYSVSIS
jgi:DNA-directed RNA polymerases I, II, and III subunit RPABC1